jgi:ATP-binding cassette, subfamily C (CFTR/MRP), member 1
VTKSPIFNYFSETVNGVSTIRAYNIGKRFINNMNYKINEHLSFFYPEIYSQRWLSVRLESISSFIVLFAAIFAVSSRDTVSGGVAGLSLSYALNISIFLTFLVRTISEFESSITSVERVKEYCETNDHEVFMIYFSMTTLEIN